MHAAEEGTDKRTERVDGGPERRETRASGGKAIKSLDTTLDDQPVLEWRNVARTDSGLWTEETRPRGGRGARSEGLEARTLTIRREGKRFVEEEEERLFEKTAVVSAPGYAQEGHGVPSSTSQSNPLEPIRVLLACPTARRPVPLRFQDWTGCSRVCAARQDQGQDGMR